MRTVLCVVLVVASVFSWGQCGHYPRTQVTTTIGNQVYAVPFPVVRVCSEPASGLTCTPLANIYSDVACTQALSNPMTGDGNGYVDFYSSSANVHLQVTTTTLPQIDVSNIALFFLAGNQTAPANQFSTGINNLGVMTFAQPSFANLSGVSTVVQTNQGNAYTTGIQDFSAAAALKVPSSAGFSATLPSIGYDSTNKNMHMGANGVDNINVMVPSASLPSNGDGAKWSVVGGVVTLLDSGNGAPIGASPAGNALQTINGPLSLGGFNFSGYAALGLVQYPDQLSGADVCAKLATAHTNLPSVGGFIDMRNLSGSPATCAAGVTFTKPVTLIWGATNITCPNSGTCMTFSGNGNKIIGTPGESQLTEGTIGTNLIVVNGNDTEITGMSFSGVSGTGISLSLDNAVKCINCQRLNMHNDDFTGLQGYALHAQQGADVSFNDNTVHGNTNGVLYRGTLRSHTNRNTFRDPQSGTTTFVTAVQFDSTSSTFGVSTDFEVNSNIFRNFTDAQSILVHAGQSGTIIGNTCDNSLWCVAVDSFQVGDTLDSIAVVGNNATHPTSGANQSGGADPNYSIEGLSGQVATNIIFVGNSGSNGNYETASDTQGCVSVQWTDGLVMTNNTLKACKGAGIAFNTGTNTRVQVQNNKVLDLVASPGGARVCYYVTTGTGQTGTIQNNSCDNAVSCYRGDVANAGIVLDPNGGACTNTTNIVTSPSNFTVGLYIPSTTGLSTTLDSAATVTRNIHAPDAGGTMVLDTATQTLTNKTLTSPTIAGGIVNSGSGVKHFRATTGSINATTRVEVSIGVSGANYADTNYTAVCTVEDSTTAAGTQGLTGERVLTKTTSHVGYVVNNPTAGALTGTVDCWTVHD